MVRSHWMGPMIAGLAWTGLAWGQTVPQAPPASPGPRAQFITVQEPGRPAQRCKVLRSWQEQDGSKAYQAQAVGSGEIMTIVESGPSAPPTPGAATSKTVTSRIFHWGQMNKPLPGIAQPPAAKPPAAKPPAPRTPPPPAPARSAPSTRPPGPARPAMPAPTPAPVRPMASTPPVAPSYIGPGRRVPQPQIQTVRPTVPAPAAKVTPKVTPPTRVAQPPRPNWDNPGPGYRPSSATMQKPPVPGYSQPLANVPKPPVPSRLTPRPPEIKPAPRSATASVPTRPTTNPPRSVFIPPRTVPVPHPVVAVPQRWPLPPAPRADRKPAPRPTLASAVVGPAVPVPATTLPQGPVLNAPSPMPPGTPTVRRRAWPPAYAGQKPTPHHVVEAVVPTGATPAMSSRQVVSAAAVPATSPLPPTPAPAPALVPAPQPAPVLVPMPQPAPAPVIVADTPPARERRPFFRGWRNPPQRSTVCETCVPTPAPAAASALKPVPLSPRAATPGTVLGPCPVCPPRAAILKPVPAPPAVVIRSPVQVEDKLKPVPAVPGPCTVCEMTPGAPCPICPKPVVVACPTCTPPQPRLVDRIFHPSAFKAAPPTAVVTAPAPPKQEPIPVVKAPAEPARPGDPCQSWGRIDDAKIVTPKREAVARRPELLSFPKGAPPAHLNLPHADTRPDDPLKNPDTYSGARLGHGMATNPPAPAAIEAPKPARRLPLGLGSVFAARDRELNARPASNVAASDANAFSPPKPKPEPKPEAPPPPSNAFTAAPPSDPAPSEATPPGMPSGRPSALPSSLPPGPMMGGYAGRPPMMLMPPMPPMPPSMRMDGGHVPPGMANAFTMANTTDRPIPADMGQVPHDPNAFADRVAYGGATAAPPAAYRMPPPVPPQAWSSAMAPRGPYPASAGPVGWGTAPSAPVASLAVAETDPGVPHLVQALRGSLYPSERELAAEQLAHQDWHTRPEVVDALLTAAREDPAPTVRAGCVHALAVMKANTIPVVTVVQDLKKDTDVRVRQEVKEALDVLLAPPTRRQDSSFHQVDSRQ